MSQQYKIKTTNHCLLQNPSSTNTQYFVFNQFPKPMSVHV